MANEEKIRILDEQPVENAGSLLYIRTLAGSSDASKPTSLMANGSVFMETDTGKVFIFDEDDGWTEMQTGGGLPAVTSADNGKVLAVEDGAWAAQQKKFIVTLTPTSPDFSGTMDKTVAEINAAYEAGMEIWFRIYESSTKYYDLKVTLTETAVSDDYPAFGAYGILTGKFILFKTDVIGSTYFTAIYSLTPAS